MLESGARLVAVSASMRPVSVAPEVARRRRPGRRLVVDHEHGRHVASLPPLFSLDCADHYSFINSFRAPHN